MALKKKNKTVLHIPQLMSQLALERKVFHSEADFQHAFAWEAHKLLPNSRVRLETRVDTGTKVFHVDCWISGGTNDLAIELKYKTCKFAIENKDEKYSLTNHSARDCGRYDFLKDVQRLEHILGPKSDFKGHAILLTNDSAYWEQARNLHTVDADFHLREGRIVTGELKWGSGASEGTKRGREEAIKLAGSYEVCWSDFSAFEPARKFGKFRYLAIEVT